MTVGDWQAVCILLKVNVPAKLVLHLKTQREERWSCTASCEKLNICIYEVILSKVLHHLPLIYSHTGRLATTQGADLPIRSTLGVHVLAKDTYDASFAAWE